MQMKMPCVGCEEKIEEARSRTEDVEWIYLSNRYFKRYLKRFSREKERDT